MSRSYVVGFVQVASLLLSLGLNAATASAATLSFNADYDILATAENLTPNLAKISLSGTSTDAPYDLNQVSSISYSQTDFTTGAYTSNTDPTAFGLQGYQPGYVKFFGNGSDSLLAIGSGNGAIDFTNLTVTISSTLTISGGEGVFTGATGTLTSSQVVPANIQIGVDLKGQNTVSGNVKAVPEPESNMTPLVAAVVAAGMLWRRRHSQRGCVAKTGKG